MLIVNLISKFQGFNTNSGNCCEQNVIVDLNVIMLETNPRFFFLVDL
jgi:hypothetical protein